MRAGSDDEERRGKKEQNCSELVQKAKQRGPGSQG